MITRNPYDRNDLKIGKKDRVLEVGPGHSPIFRSDVLVDLFVDTNYHRCRFIRIRSLSMPMVNLCLSRIKSLITLFAIRCSNTRKILRILSASNAGLPRGGIWKLPVC